MHGETTLSTPTAQRQMILTLLQRDTPTAQIAELVGVSEDELADILAEPEFVELATGFGSPGGSDNDPVTAAEALAWTESMTRPAMTSLQNIITNPRTPPTSLLRAIELVLGWRAEFAPKKSDVERRLVQHLLFDQAVLERMQGFLDIIHSPDIQQQIDDARALMPNSTA